MVLPLEIPVPPNAQAHQPAHAGEDEEARQSSIRVAGLQRLIPRLN
jgi:hypothetical protein